MFLGMKKILACLFSACCLLQALLELVGLLGLLPPDFLTFESFSAAQAMWLLFLTLLLGFLLFSYLEKKTETVCSGHHSGETDEACATGEGNAVAASFRLAITSASLYLFFYALRRGDPFIQLGVFLLALYIFSLSYHAVSSAIPAEPGCEHANHEDKAGKDEAHVKDCGETQVYVKDIAGMFPKWLLRLELIQLFPLGLALTTAVHFFLLLLLPGGVWRLEPEQVEAWGIFLLVLLPALLVGGAVVLFVRLKPDSSLLGHSEMEASPMTASRVSSNWLLLPLALLHIGVLSRILVLRVQNFNTPNFDFGLFVQMFYYMDKTGLPLTTLERNTLLSHFQVHFSPIFYLLLPFYKLWPRPETLQILQILVAASALIPAFLIVRELRLPRGWQTALCALLLLHPGLSGSSLYDLHENCFLAPLILWLLWAALRRKWAAFSVFALLLLGVKEDAFIYLFSVGLWLFCGGIQGCEGQAVLDPLKTGETSERLLNAEAGENRQAMKAPEKKQWQPLSSNSVQVAGLFSMLAALIFFTAVSAWLSRGGEGVMLYRFENIQALPDWGLLGYVLTVIGLPGWILEQLFMPDKLLYLLKMLLPFGLVPLFSRRLRHGFLLLPFVVINLLSNWSYQYDLNFQYHYGTTVLLFFVSALVLWESQTTWQPDLQAACGGSEAHVVLNQQGERVGMSVGSADLANIRNSSRPSGESGFPAQGDTTEHVSVCSLPAKRSDLSADSVRAVSRTEAFCCRTGKALVAALLAFALFSASALTLPEWSWRLRSELAEASLDQFSPDVHEALAAIPESDCVYTTGFFAAALAARPHIFEVGPYASYPIDASDPVCQPDVIVLDERYPEEIDAMAGQIADWEAEGFVTSYRKVGVLRILKKGKK